MTKLLISGASNSGKTSLLKGLENALIISIDGKKFPMAMPHVNISDFDDVDHLINTINTKVAAYQEKFGALPAMMVFDTVSRIFETIANNCNKKYTGFAIYTELNKEVAKFNAYIENTLVANNISTIILSHATYDADTGKYELVSQGSFKKIGGFLSVVDEAIFLETKGSKRIIHHKSTKFPARSIVPDLASNVPLEEFNLSTHMDLLAKHTGNAAEHEL